MLHQICSTKNPFDLRCESVTYTYVYYLMIHLTLELALIIVTMVRASISLLHTAKVVKTGTIIGEKKPVT